MTEAPSSSQTRHGTAVNQPDSAATPLPRVEESSEAASEAERDCVPDSVSTTNREAPREDHGDKPDSACGMSTATEPPTASEQEDETPKTSDAVIAFTSETGAEKATNLETDAAPEAPAVLAAEAETPAPASTADSDGATEAGAPDAVAAPSDHDAPAASSDHDTEHDAPAVSLTKHADAEESEASTPDPEEAPTRTEKVEMQPVGCASRCFDGLSWFGIVALASFLGLQVLLGLEYRSGFWLPGEEIHATVLETLRQSGEWLIFQIQGAPYVSLPPGYTWFLWGLGEILPLPQPLLLLVGSAISALIMLTAVWGLALATGQGRRTAFASGCVLLTTLAVPALAHYATPDFLFAGLVALSALCLYRGWVAERAYLLLTLGFVLAALATFVKGPMGLALPLLASVLFPFWRCSFRRAGHRDGAIGFGLMLVLVLGWLSWLAIQNGGKPYLTALLDHHLLAPLRALQDGTLPSGIALCRLSTLILPWFLLVLFLPWERLYRVPVHLWKNRKADPGTGWLWCLALAGVVLFVFSPTAAPSDGLVLLPALVILIGRAVLHLGPTRSALFFGLIGLLWLVAGLGLCLLAFTVLFDAILPTFLTTWIPEPWLPILPALEGLPYVAGLALLCAFLLLKATRRDQPAGSLLVLLFLVTALVQPISYFAPSLVEAGLAQPVSSAPADVPAPAAEPAAQPATQPASEAPPATPPAPEATPAAPTEAAPAPADTAPATPPAEAMPAAPAEAAPAASQSDPATPATPAPEIPAAQAAPAAEPAQPSQPAQPAQPETPPAAAPPVSETAPATERSSPEVRSEAPLS